MEEEQIEMRAMNEADLLDPNPDIRALFCHYNQLYFNNALGACTVDWSSKRMTLCAGICQYMKMGGCAIRLSEPLLKFRSTTDLKNTLLHEMIHAYLWLTDRNKDHNDHGPCFQKMMMEINSSMLPDHQRPACGYSLSIYHNFTDEVDNYRTHHWKCQICEDLIRRAMNRQPSASDCMRRVIHNGLCNDTRCHWHQHKKNCCGEYIKIAEPAGYQEKRRRIKISGKQDHDGQVKDGKILKKLSKGSLVTDHIKEESLTGASSQGTLPLDFFYPKLEKKVNLSLDENPVFDQKFNEEYSDEILILKRRKKNLEENVKAGLSSTTMPKADERSKCNSQERVKACPSSTLTSEVAQRRKCNPEGRVKSSPSSTLTPEVKQRGECNPEERVKAGPFLTLTTEAENKFCKKVERRCQKSEDAVTSGTCEMDFDVIIKWKDWYAFEREDEHEDLQPLINKRQERRRHEKMLSSVGIQNGCDTQVSVEATGCKESYNANISISQTGRTDTTESHTQTNLIKGGNPGLDTSTSTTGMVGRETCLTGVTRNLECSCVYTAVSSPISLPSLGNNRTETCIKREESCFQHTGVEEMVSEPSSERNIHSSSVEVEESSKLITAAKYGYFGSAGNVGEKSIRSETVDEKEMLHEDMDLDLKGRVSDELAQLDDTDIDAVFPSAQSIKHDTGPFNWHFHSKSSGNLEGDTVALDKMNSIFEISDSDSQDCINPFENLQEDTFALEERNSSLELFDSESERNCPKNFDMGDKVNKKRTSRLVYLNKQSKKERKMARQDQVGKVGNAGISAACPVCNIVLEGDITKGDFNQRFNAHLDSCI